MTHSNASVRLSYEITFRKKSGGREFNPRSGHLLLLFFWKEHSGVAAFIAFEAIEELAAAIG